MSSHSRIKKSLGTGWQLILTSALFAGCASQPKPPPAAVLPPTPPVLDASYDWHSLLVAPFGTALRDIHFTLHEVLLFDDRAQAHTAPADDAECYAIEGTTPQFLQHAASEYLLCFRHDRLARIEAAVQLPVDRAALNFADACGLWLKNAATGAKPEAPSGAPAATDTCEGVQAAISFSARLDPGDTDTLLSIKLNAADAVLERR